MTRRTFMAAVSAAAITANTKAQSPPRRKGIHALGFANFMPGDVTLLSMGINSVKGRLEVAHLPFNFNPRNPLGNMRNLINDTSGTSGLDLTVTTHLDFHSSTSYQLVHDSFFNGFRWGMFTTGQATDNQRLGYLMSIRWLDRLDGYVSFVNVDRSVQTKATIHHILAPMLEDNCPTVSQYSHLLNVIANYLSQHHSGFTVQYRRSGSSRVGSLPLELHTPSVPAGLGSGDAWANDGFPLSVDEFVRQQTVALSQGISSLRWDKALNGLDVHKESDHPDIRTDLTPLSKNNNRIYNELIRCWSA